MLHIQSNPADELFLLEIYSFNMKIIENNIFLALLVCMMLLCEGLRFSVHFWTTLEEALVHIFTLNMFTSFFIFIYLPITEEPNSWSNIKNIGDLYGTRIKVVSLKCCFIWVSGMLPPTLSYLEFSYLKSSIIDLPKDTMDMFGMIKLLLDKIAFNKAGPKMLVVYYIVVVYYSKNSRVFWLHIDNYGIDVAFFGSMWGFMYIFSCFLRFQICARQNVKDMLPYIAIHYIKSLSILVSMIIGYHF
ncbi:hypothetical protein ACJX0J_020658 [Zea mays]